MYYKLWGNILHFGLIIFLCAVSLLLQYLILTGKQAAANNDKFSVQSAANRKRDSVNTGNSAQYMHIDEAQPRPLLNRGKSSSLRAVYAVRPVLFLAGDVKESPGNIRAIDETFQVLRRWYSGSLQEDDTGYLFSLEETSVYRARKKLSYYRCRDHTESCRTNDGVWQHVQAELLGADYPLWQEGTIYIVFVKGIGGWVGTGCAPECYGNWPSPGPAAKSGVSIVGDWGLDAITGTVNQDCFNVFGASCFTDPQRGAIGHELGHAFGLAHANGSSESIMSDWWLFPSNSLSDSPGNDEKSLLRKSPFFTRTKP